MKKKFHELSPGVPQPFMRAKATSPESSAVPGIANHLFAFEKNNNFFRAKLMNLNDL